MTEPGLNPFDADIAVEPFGGDRFGAVIRENWWVGRGPNGGYVAAILMNALGTVLPDRPPRSLSIHYLRPPAAGPAEVAVRIDRQGRSASFLSARLVQDGKTCVSALAAFSDPWKGPSYEAYAMPKVRPPEELSHLIPEEQNLPRFFHNYEAVPAIGPPPFESAEETLTGGWIRSREPRPLDPPLAAAILDAWIPTAFIVLDRPHPAPTLDLTIHFRSPLPAPTGGSEDWYLSVFRSGLARDGFFDEDGELWSADGRLLAQSRQLALLLGSSSG
jgi:acyl-CoA thioesterase